MCWQTVADRRPSGDGPGFAYLRGATAYVDVFCRFVEAHGTTEEPKRAFVKRVYRGIFDSISDAQEWREATGNREPEMAEAIEALEFIRDDFRSGFDLR